MTTTQTDQKRNRQYQVVKSFVTESLAIFLLMVFIYIYSIIRNKDISQIKLLFVYIVSFYFKYLFSSILINNTEFIEFATSYVYAITSILLDVSWWVKLQGIGIEERFILNNTARIFQLLFISYIACKYIYKDRRCNILKITLSIISVVYFISIIYILLGAWNIQNMIFSSRYFLGAIILLSLIDYGKNIYDKLFNFSLFDSKLFSYIFSYKANTDNQAIRKDC